MSNWLGVILFFSTRYVDSSAQRNALRRFAEFQPKPLGYEFQSGHVMVSFRLDAENKLAADVQLADLSERLERHLNDEHLSVSSFSTEEERSTAKTKAPSIHTFFVLFRDQRSTVVRASDYLHYSGAYYLFRNAKGEHIAEFLRSDVEAILRADSIYGSPLISGLLSS